MGTCGEDADGGEQSGGPPRPPRQLRQHENPVSTASPPIPITPKPALNLLGSAPTYCCLGHCITRGISLRRQASILRLRGAVRSGRPLPEARFVIGPYWNLGPRTGLCRTEPEFGACPGGRISPGYFTPCVGQTGHSGSSRMVDDLLGPAGASNDARRSLERVTINLHNLG